MSARATSAEEDDTPGRLAVVDEIAERHEKDNRLKVLDRMKGLVFCKPIIHNIRKGRRAVGDVQTTFLHTYVGVTCHSILCCDRETQTIAVDSEPARARISRDPIVLSLPAFSLNDLQHMYVWDYSGPMTYRFHPEVAVGLPEGGSSVQSMSDAESQTILTRTLGSLLSSSVGGFVVPSDEPDKQKIVAWLTVLSFNGFAEPLAEDPSAWKLAQVGTWCVLVGQFLRNPLRA